MESPNVQPQIHFQYGMSIAEFLSNFGAEAHCAESFKRSRWPQGFSCPNRASAQYFFVAQGALKALKYRNFAQIDFAAFALRFNHRSDLSDMIFKLIVEAERKKQLPEKAIRSRHDEVIF